MKRMISKFFPALAIVAALGLAGCAAQGEQNAWGMGNKQTMGTLGGAAIGGILGSNVGSGKGQIAATAIGTLLGAYAGSSVGKSLDSADRAAYDRAAYQAYDAPLNQTIRWDNPQSGNYGTITPVRQGTNASTGAVCREYRQTITVGGRQEEAIGQACKNPDGTWTVVN